MKRLLDFAMLLVVLKALSVVAAAVLVDHICLLERQAHEFVKSSAWAAKRCLKSSVLDLQIHI